MEAEKENYGQSWHQGQLKKSGQEYVLETEERELEVSETELTEQVWNDLSSDPKEVMLYGELYKQETITGRENYSLENLSKAGYILEEDYDGRKVFLTGYNLVFLDEEEEIAYESDGYEEMRDNLKGWFDDETENEIMETIADLKLEKDYWPWGTDD